MKQKDTTTCWEKKPGNLVSTYLHYTTFFLNWQDKINFKTTARQLVYKKENILVLKIVEMSIFQKVVLRFIQALIRNHYTF